jgi:hypothetical protein
MQYVLGNMLNGGGGLNPDGLALDLQFAADKTLTARKGPTPVFTRGSTGTFVGSNGLIQSAAINAARFDHDSAGVCRGLLIEESRTNVALYSGALVGGTGWSLSQTTSVVSGTGPDGNNAYEVADDSTTNVHSILNTGSTTGAFATSVVSGTTYTGSVFLKKIAGSVDWAQVSMGAAGFGAAQYANFNLSTGQVGNFAGLSSGTSPRIEAFANGWYRCSISVTAILTTTISPSVVLFLTNNTNATTRAPSYNGNTANKFLAAMAQFEVGSFATSYIPTVASSVVRSADVCSISGANFTSFWNQTEGSLFASAIFNAPANYNTAQFFCDVNDNTSENRVRFYRNPTAPTFEAANISSNTQDAVITSSAQYASNVTHKASLGIKQNDYEFFANNATIGTDSSVVLPVNLNTFRIGNSSSAVAARPTNGTISAIRYYRKRLSNAKLQALTA